MPISRDHENISEHYLLVNFIAIQPMSTDVIIILLKIDVKIDPSMLTSMKILLAQRTNLI